MNLGWPPNVSAASCGAFPQMPWPTNVALVANAQA